MFCKRPGARTHRLFSSLKPPPRLAYVRRPLQNTDGPWGRECTWLRARSELARTHFSHVFHRRSQGGSHRPTHQHRKFSKPQTTVMILWMESLVEPSFLEWLWWFTPTTHATSASAVTDRITQAQFLTCQIWCSYRPSFPSVLRFFTKMMVVL